MPVDPRQDVDICITCLSKNPPKLPLREELPSLGVELIYKARGFGAKISKHEARRAARSFLEKESFKDLTKRRLFPKSSKRIKEKLEERRRRESEIKHVSEAVSYERYQSELYADWVTDTSSSSSRSRPSSSSTESSVSEINTGPNRRMTKVALKRWQLFRKQARKRRAKVEKAKKEKERINKVKIQRNSKSNASVGSLIGTDVFADFLAPLPYIEDLDEEPGVETPAVWKNHSPSSQAKGANRRTPGESARSEFSKQSSTLHSTRASSPNARSRPQKFSRTNTPEERLPVSWKKQRADPTLRSELKSPTTADNLEHMLDSSPKYPEAKSPPSAMGIKQSSKNSVTPTTMATSPATTDQNTAHEASLASSPSESPKRTRRERLFDGNGKLGRYLPYRKNRHETSHEEIIPESESKESASDTSLIGLSVAFPHDESILDATSPLQNPVFPRNVLVQEDRENPYISDDTGSHADETTEQPSTISLAGEYQSSFFDGVPLSVYGPSRSYSWKDTSVLGMGGTSQEFQLAAPNKVKEVPLSPASVVLQKERASRASLPATSPLLDDIPEDLYEAFGRNKPRPQRLSANVEPIQATAVFSDQVDASCISPRFPVVQGIDVPEDETPGNSRKDSKQDYLHEVIQVDEAWNLSLPKSKSHGSEGRKKTSLATVIWDLVLPKARSSDETHAWETAPLMRWGDRQGGHAHGEPQPIIVEEEDEEETPMLTSSPIQSVEAARMHEDGSLDDVIEIESNAGHAEREIKSILTIERTNWWEGASIGSPNEPKNDDQSENEAELGGAGAAVFRGTTLTSITSKHPQIEENAAKAFADIPDEIYGALKGAIDKHKQDKDRNSLENVIREKQFRLSQYETSIEEVSAMLTEDPTLVQIKDQEDGQMLLHRIASSPFPSHVDGNNFIDALLEDIYVLRKKLDLICNAFPPASELVDFDGDLPVHLLARNLMHWETTWYAKVYGAASKESDTGLVNGPASLAITDLYYSMSLCIQTLLIHVVSNKDLCRERGSMGVLIPLHIATIFTSPVCILRQALESYPEGALESSLINGFDSFVPDGALPIEIHDAFCTDFPKWEVEKIGPGEMKWSQLPGQKTNNLEDRIRRSDLLFAYNPSIQKFWKDGSRIRRLEIQINFEAKETLGTSRKTITTAAARAWIWMCTFTGPSKKRALILKSVERIISDLSFNLVRMLALVNTTTSGDPVIDVAHEDCVAAIRMRLDNLSETLSPPTTICDSSNTATSKVLQSWDETQIARLAQRGKVNLGQVCRAIFNIKEKDIPTSFVILPYKLARNSNGTLGMSTAESAAVAIKFADCLLQLTDPKSVLYYIDKKSESYFGVSMYEGAGDAAAREQAFKKVERLEKNLLELYATRTAFLYLLDEETGVPLVPSSEDIYPMVLNEPISMVRKLLPIMIPGMIQMRGEKAVLVLSTTLLDDTIQVVPSHYEEAANKLSIFMYSPLPSSERVSEESEYIKGELNRFLSSFHKKHHRTENTLTGTTEWNVELSILRMLFEVNDPRSTFSGLIQDETQNEEPRWIFDEGFERKTSAENRPKATVYVYADKQSGGKQENEARSREDSSSLADSYTTFGAGPLKFHQPPDDVTATTFETQASPAVAITRDEIYGKDFGCDDALQLASIESINSTESERMKTKYKLLIDTFAPEVEKSYVDRDTSNPDPDSDELWNPAEQVWTDVVNRLDVTTFFWDEAQITNLRVGLAQQANTLCLLQRRIKAIKQDEYRHARRLQELINRLTDEDANIVEVTSPRSLFGVRKLLIRLNDLETRLLESEVDSQQVGIRVAALNEEIFDLVPLIEEEFSSASSSCDSSSGSSQSCSDRVEDTRTYMPHSQKVRILFPGDVSDILSNSSAMEKSGILSQAMMEDLSKAEDSYSFEEVSAIESTTRDYSQDEAWSNGGDKKSLARMDQHVSIVDKADDKDADNPIPPPYISWSGSKSIERIRKAFAAARRDNATYLTRYSSDTQSKTTAELATKSRVSTESHTSAVQPSVSITKSSGGGATYGTQFPVEIALPALDHKDTLDKNKLKASNGYGPVRQTTTRKYDNDDDDTSDDSPASITGNGAFSEDSTTSSSFEENSIVKYDRETGMIEF